MRKLDNAGSPSAPSAATNRMMVLQPDAARQFLRIMGILVHHDGHSTVLGEHGVDVQDKPGNEARMFGAAPPGFAAHCSEQAAQECPSRRFESPLRKDTAQRSVPDMESRPGVFGQHLLQPQLIGSIQGALSAKTSGHELGNVAVSGDCLTNYRPLRHSGIVLVALERARYFV